MKNDQYQDKAAKPHKISDLLKRKCRVCLSFTPWEESAGHRGNTVCADSPGSWWDTADRVALKE